MNKLLNALHRFWFDPAPAGRLAFVRILTAGYCLWYLLTRHSHFTAYSKISASLFEPVGLAAMLSEPMPESWAQALYYATLLAGIAFLLGWKFRISGPAFALLLIAALSYRYSWSMIYHDFHIVAAHVLILGLSASADAWSLDRRSADPKASHWRYGWPIRLLCAATVLTYFVSGVAKIQSELGWGWMSGGELKLQVAADALRKEVLGESGTTLFKVLYPYNWIFTIVGLFTLIVELGAPLFLANKRLSRLWAASGWLMHWGIFLIMGIRFRYQMSGLVFLSFFDVEKLPGYFARLWRNLGARPEAASASAASVVLFDGACNFCNAWVRFIFRRDSSGRFNFASQQSDQGRNLLAAHGAPNDLSTLILVAGDGRVYVKSEAVWRILVALGGVWRLAAFMRVLPVGLRDRAYDAFARNRYRLFGKKEVCEMPPPDFGGRVLG